MEERTPTATLGLLLTLFFITSAYSSMVNSRELPHSPSPSPAPMGGDEAIVERRHERTKKGSYPARCHAKCNQCKPCMPVQVSIRSMELKEKDYYYPQVWKCACGDYIFSP